MEKTNSDISSFLRRIADLLELKGENPFKTRSYRGASGVIDDLGGSAAEMARAGGSVELQKLPGIGKSISGQIVEFVSTGTSTFFEQLRREIPETAADLLVVRGIGMKLATTLYRDFGILDLDDLQRFAEGGGFESVAGLGDKTIARLVPAVERAAAGRIRVPLVEAEREAETLADAVRGVAGVGSAIVAGEVRRRRASVSELELVAVTEVNGREIAEALARLPAAREAFVVVDERAEVMVHNGLRATVHIATPDRQWVALVRATGSPRHVRELEEIAAERGFEFRADGLYEAGEPAPVELDGEADLYERLGLSFIAPDRRDGG